MSFTSVSSGCQNRIPQTGGLKPQALISHSSEGSGVQDQDPSGLCCPVRALLLARRELSTLCVLTWLRESLGTFPPLIRQEPLDQGPTSMTSFTLPYLLKAATPNTVILGVNTSTHELGGKGDTFLSQHSFTKEINIQRNVKPAY